MTQTGLSLYQAEDVRKLDQLTIELQGVSGYELMCTAALAGWNRLITRWPEVTQIIVYCGAGNNAGDGYVLARLAKEQGYQVKLLQLCKSKSLKGDALTAFNDYMSAGGEYEFFELSNAKKEMHIIDSGDPGSEKVVIVDALLGTGLQRPLEGAWQQAVTLINKSKANVMALDIPSGLDSDSGNQLGEAVKADMTVTFIGRKRGMYTADGRDCCGSIIFECLGVRDSIYERLGVGEQTTELLQAQMLHEYLPPRAHNTHKGSHGHVLIVGGSVGFSGAVVLAATAALRSGAGLVSVATDPVHAALLDSAYPEIMCHAVADELALEKLLAAADVVVMGPGLGRQAWSKLMFNAVFNCDQPLVLDADALNLMASIYPENSNKIPNKNRIMTPHPGEAATLLSCGSAEIQYNRFDSVKKLAELFKATVVLKGSGTLVRAASTEKQLTVTSVCEAGNPGMASAGTGDVLSGVIAAFVAQGLSPVKAARAGVLAHALAGDLAAQSAQRGLIASDIVDCLRAVVNPL